MHMIAARIVLADPLEPGTLDLVIPLAEGYGHTSEIAHAILLLCITAAERPVVVDAFGSMYRIPKECVRAVVTWSHEYESSIEPNP